MCSIHIMGTSFHKEGAAEAAPLNLDGGAA